MPTTTRRAAAPETPHTNGVSARPVRTVTAVIDLDGYTGWTAAMQSNPPLRVLDDLDRTTEFDVMRAALVALVQRHTFPLAGDLNDELNAEEVWALRRGYITALNEVTTPSPKS